MLTYTGTDREILFDHRCYFCFVRAFERLLESKSLLEDEKKRFVGDMFNIFNCTENDLSITKLSRELHILFKQYTHSPDPYKGVKKKSNDQVLEMYPKFRERVKASADSFDTALRLAIAGNIIDYGITDNIDLESAMSTVFSNNYSIDDSFELKKDLSKVKKVLYLGDNCGEIVFDKLLIETILHPNLTYVVRGAPVINDATIEDARYIGMESAAKVISNGYDAPSTILEQCSQEFIAEFNSSDIIISKGQGNLEGLFGETEKTIYFLLMVKCDVIADNLGVKKGDFVVKKQARIVT